MKRMIVLLLILPLFFSCNEENDFRDYYSYSTPVFVGMDSILYVEHYAKLRESGNDRLMVLENNAQLKIMDIHGQEVSTIWSNGLGDNPDLGYWSCNGISYAKDTNILVVGYSNFVRYENVVPEIMIMDLQGNILTYFTDLDFSDLVGQASGERNVLCSSPDGLYYAIANKIKNTSGELIKTIDHEIIDWNSKGLLARSDAKDSTKIDIEGVKFKVFTHPNAQSWYGHDSHYLTFMGDTVKICKWNDSSVLKELLINYSSPYSSAGYGGGYGYSAYPLAFLNSAISPDLRYLVLANNGIHLIDLISGESKLIKSANSY